MLKQAKRTAEEEAYDQLCEDVALNSWTLADDADAETDREREYDIPDHSLLALILQ